MPKIFIAEVNSWRSFSLNLKKITRAAINHAIKDRFPDADVTAWDWIRIINHRSD